MMFEDIRKQAEESSFAQDHDLNIDAYAQFGEGRFLGLSPFQRFLVALMLLMMIVILGTLFLAVTSKIVLPFL